jgi:hypothetical protein
MLAFSPHPIELGRYFINKFPHCAGPAMRKIRNGMLKCLLKAQQSFDVILFAVEELGCNQVEPDCLGYAFALNDDRLLQLLFDR